MSGLVFFRMGNPTTGDRHDDWEMPQKSLFPVIYLYWDKWGNPAAEILDLENKGIGVYAVISTVMVITQNPIEFM